MDWEVSTTVFVSSSSNRQLPEKGPLLDVACVFGFKACTPVYTCYNARRMPIVGRDKVY